MTLNSSILPKEILRADYNTITLILIFQYPATILLLILSDQLSQISKTSKEHFPLEFIIKKKDNSYTESMLTSLQSIPSLFSNSSRPLPLPC